MTEVAAQPGPRRTDHLCRRGNDSQSAGPGRRPERRISRDAHDQRSSRCATGDRESERSERRLRAGSELAGLLQLRMQITHSSAPIMGAGFPAGGAARVCVIEGGRGLGREEPGPRTGRSGLSARELDQARRRIDAPYWAGHAAGSGRLGAEEPDLDRLRGRAPPHHGLNRVASPCDRAESLWHAGAVR